MTHLSAVDGGGPITDRAIRVLVSHIKREGPLTLAHGVFPKRMLTVRTLEQACFKIRSAFPKSAAVYTRKV